MYNSVENVKLFLSMPQRHTGGAEV